MSFLFIVAHDIWIEFIKYALTLQTCFLLLYSLYLCTLLLYFTQSPPRQRWRRSRCPTKRLLSSSAPTVGPWSTRTIWVSVFCYFFFHFCVSNQWHLCACSSVICLALSISCVILPMSHYYFLTQATVPTCSNCPPRSTRCCISRSAAAWWSSHALCCWRSTTSATMGGSRGRRRSNWACRKTWPSRCVYFVAAVFFVISSIVFFSLNSIFVEIYWNSLSAVQLCPTQLYYSTHKHTLYSKFFIIL